MSLGRFIGRLFNREPKPRNVSHAAFTAEHQADEEPTPTRCGSPIVAHVHADGSVDVDQRVAAKVRAAHPALKPAAAARSIARSAITPPSKKTKLVVQPRKKTAKKKAPKR
jgi:hypothetical protein